MAVNYLKKIYTGR